MTANFRLSLSSRAACVTAYVLFSNSSLFARRKERFVLDRVDFAIVLRGGGLSDLLLEFWFSREFETRSCFLREGGDGTESRDGLFGSHRHGIVRLLGSLHLTHTNTFVILIITIM